MGESKGVKAMMNKRGRKTKRKRARKGGRKGQEEKAREKGKSTRAWEKEEIIGERKGELSGLEKSGRENEKEI